jgi:hypothetical protein
MRRTDLRAGAHTGVTCQNDLGMTFAGDFTLSKNYIVV